MRASSFQTRTVQSCFHLAPKKNLLRVDVTFYTLINFFRKLIQYFSFTITHKVVFKDFACFLGTANLRSNSLLVRTMTITCRIPCKRLIVLNLIFIGAVLARRLGENSCSESFYKTRGVINEGFTY